MNMRTQMMQEVMATTQIITVMMTILPHQVKTLTQTITMVIANKKMKGIEKLKCLWKVQGAEVRVPLAKIRGKYNEIQTTLHPINLSIPLHMVRKVTRIT